MEIPTTHAIQTQFKNALAEVCTDGAVTIETFTKLLRSNLNPSWTADVNSPDAISTCPVGGGRMLFRVAMRFSIQSNLGGQAQQSADRISDVANRLDGLIAADSGATLNVELHEPTTVAGTTDLECLARGVISSLESTF